MKTELKEIEISGITTLEELHKTLCKCKFAYNEISKTSLVDQTKFFEIINSALEMVSYAKKSI